MFTLAKFLEKPAERVYLLGAFRFTITSSLEHATSSYVALNAVNVITKKNLSFSVEGEDSARIRALPNDQAVAEIIKAQKSTTIDYAREVLLAGIEIERLAGTPLQALWTKLPEPGKVVRTPSFSPA